MNLDRILTTAAPLCTLVLIASTASAQTPRFRYHQDGRSTGSVTSSAYAGPPPAVGVAGTDSFNQSIPLGSGGGTETGSGGIGAFAFVPMNPLDLCPNQELVTGETDVRWTARATTTGMSFSSSADDYSMHQVVGGFGPTGGPFSPALWVIADAEQQISAIPLQIDLPVEVTTNGTLTLRSFAIQRHRFATGTPMTEFGGGTSAMVVLYGDSNADGLPDGAGAFAATLSAGNNQSLSLPQTSVPITAGRYVVRFEITRMTSDELTVEACGSSAQAEVSTTDSVEISLQIS